MMNALIVRTISDMNQLKAFWQWLSRLFVITLRKSHLIILIVILQCWQNFVIYWCCNVRFSAHSRNMPFTLQLASTKSLLQFHYTCPQEIPRWFMKMRKQKYDFKNSKLCFTELVTIQMASCISRKIKITMRPCFHKIKLL